MLTYTVQIGDSWSSVAARTGVSVRELQAANPRSLRQNEWLLVGETLVIPGRATATPAAPEATGPVTTTAEVTPRASEPGGQGAAITPSMEPPRPQLSYIKAAIPDYALTDLKTRALQDEVTVNHLILKALTGLGITIRPEHMVEDGRRLRGRNAMR